MLIYKKYSGYDQRQDPEPSLSAEDKPNTSCTARKHNNVLKIGTRIISKGISSNRMGRPESQFMQFMIPWRKPIREVRPGCNTPGEGAHYVCKAALVDGLTVEEMQQRQYARATDVRGAYYRDTTAIIHSSPYRRLKHKTQVFFAPRNDHICTRIEHVLHVASIATAICRGLGLDTNSLGRVGMGHDLGHTPFGHVGEQIIQEIMQEKGFRWI